MQSRYNLIAAAAMSHAQRLLISRVGAKMARGHAHLILARPQFAALLTTQLLLGCATSRRLVYEALARGGAR